MTNQNTKTDVATVIEDGNKLLHSHLVATIPQLQPANIIVDSDDSGPFLKVDFFLPTIKSTLLDVLREGVYKKSNGKFSWTGKLERDGVAVCILSLEASETHILISVHPDE